ncbi:non-hydrolyzing UDP-N-acetylglucosamine 2-epimerase [Brevundimonas sp.]|uniref:non-hydrolyzing UDP-N-acetylglucosamine 2-epimerase n=1 Tax=Brevundimonas sp. TaxID=1871086 RepID=UPI002D561EA3|nr:UDP-N-acetylglucosamine 2-epimerase (non-hydrolyzing) [Brevundimonas sp.]HYC67406.1 UDP-N-acetylglucosamine 2-epimerase (non-hydrolyzing) [Brevundimonas sp.]
MKPVLCVFGTRPEAIKMAPVVRRLRECGVPHRVAVTAQHREMLDQVLDIFGIVPDYDLDLMTPNQSLAELNARCLVGVDRVISECDPVCVVGQGDTTTVFASALAAFYRDVPFAHVEAGLRSGNLRSPFPEEFNRVAAGKLTSLHFAPTRLAQDTLLREGVDPAAVLLTGNTVIDAVETARGLIEPLTLPGFDSFGLITVHRRENFGRPVEDIIAAIREVALARPGFGFVWPVHPNPQIKGRVEAGLQGLPNVFLRAPLDYREFLSALSGASLALSDSGGVQEEAPTLKTPVLVLRTETERPEGVHAGAALLIGVERTSIVDNTLRLIDDAQAREAMIVDTSPYGDGRSAIRIVEALVKRYVGEASGVGMAT